MFERTRVGSALYGLCDLVGRQGLPVDKQVIHGWAAPLIDGAVKNMKRLRLKPDQAAAALVLNLVNSLHQSDLFEKAQEVDYEDFLCLIRLYHGTCKLVLERPDHFRWAKEFFDDDVFEATTPIQLDGFEAKRRLAK